MKFTVEGDTRDHDNLKDKIRTTMIPILKEKVPQMLKELREGNALIYVTINNH